MVGSLGIWLIGFLWLFAAPPVHGRGDTFEAEYTEGKDADEAGNPSDDILDINRAQIFPEGPESSFLMEGGIIKAVSHESPFWLFLSASPRWPKKRGVVQIPYVISSRYDKSSVKIIQEAFEDFSRFTCIKFVPHSYQRDFISVAPLSGSVVHSGADQDKSIGISWNEILTGFEMNFMKSRQSSMLVDYDYSSMMRYGRNAFRVTGLPNILPFTASSASLGQRWRLSKSDIDQINKLYQCSQVAADPEMSTGRVMRKNVMDFAPRQPQPCSVENKVKASGPQTFSTVASAAKCTPSTRQTLGPSGSSSRKAVDEGTSIPEDHMKTTWPPGKGNQMPTVGSPGTSGEGKNQEASPAATEKRLHETQSSEMKMPSVGSAVKKASVALQSLTSRPKEVGSQPPSYQEDFFTTGQTFQEARIGTTAEMEPMPSFVTEGLDPFSADMVQRPVRRSGRKEVEEELLGTTRVMPIKHRTELSTVLGMGSSLGTRSTKSESESGSPNLTKDYGFFLTENSHKEQPKEVVHQAISIPGKERGQLAHTSQMGNVHTETMSSSYRTFTSRISRSWDKSSSVAELEQGTVGFAHIRTPSRVVEEAIESSDGHNVSGPPSKWSPSGRKQDATHKLEHGVLPSKEALPLLSVMALGGTPSIPWAGVTGHLAVSQQKEGTNSWGSPAGPSLEEEPFSQVPPYRVRKGHIKVTYVTRGSIFMKAERHTPGAYVDLPSQMPNSEEWTSPIMENDQATQPTEGTHPPRPLSPKTDSVRSMVSWLQSSSREVYSPTAFSVTWTPSGDKQGRETEHGTEPPSTARGEKPLAGQETSWIHEEEPGTRPSEETKTHGKVSLWRLVSNEPLRSPVPTQHGQWMAGNQGTLSPTTFTGEGQSQRPTQSPNSLGTTVPVRQCGSFSGTKHPLMEDTTKRKVSLHTQPKTGAANRERQRGETKECSSPSKGRPQPVTDMGTSLSWVARSSNLKERERTGHDTGVPKGEALPASMSELTHWPLQKTTQENPYSQGADHSISAGPSHFSTLSVLRNPAFTSASVSSPFLGTEWMMSPAPRSLQSDPGKTIGATPNVTILPAEGRPTREVTPGRNGGQSTIQPETLSHVPTEEGALSLSTGSLEFTKLMDISEGSSSSHQRMGFPTSPGKPVTVAPYLTGAFSLEFGASQSNAPIGSKEASNTVSIERGGTRAEISAGTLASVEGHRVVSGGSSILGSYDVHTRKATPPLLQHQPPTETGPLEEMIWETAGLKGTKPVSEKEGGNLTLKSGPYESEMSTAAMYTEIGAKRSRLTGFGAPNLASWWSPQSTYSNSTEETEKLGTLPEEKGSTERTAGLPNKPHWIPVSDTQMPEAASSVLGVLESPGTHKVERLFPLEVSSENVYLRDTVPTAEAAVTLGTSHSHAQKSGSVETGFWSRYIMSHVTQGPEQMQDDSGFLLMNGTYGEMSIGEIGQSSTEPPKQIPESHTGDKVEETTRERRTGRKPMYNKGSYVDQPGSLHHIVKRSVPKVVGFPGPLSPRKMKLSKESSKKQVLRRTWVASAGGLTSHRAVSGAFKTPAGRPLASPKDRGVPPGKTTKPMQMAKATQGSKAWALLWRLPSNGTKAGNDTEILKRTRKAAHCFFCSFEKDLCSWTESKEEGLGWVSEEEKELLAVPVEDGATSGTPCKISGSHLSLNPPDLPVQKTILISPVTSSSGCLKFWYHAMDTPLGEINFYIKPLNFSEWHKVCSMKGDKGTGWHRVTVPISETSELQGETLEGVVVRSPLGIGDLRVCWKPCWQRDDTAASALCDK